MSEINLPTSDIRKDQLGPMSGSLSTPPVNATFVPLSYSAFISSTLGKHVSPKGEYPSTSARPSKARTSGSRIVGRKEEGGDVLGQRWGWDGS